MKLLTSLKLVLAMLQDGNTTRTIPQMQAIGALERFIQYLDRDTFKDGISRKEIV